MELCHAQGTVGAGDPLVRPQAVPRNEYQKQGILAHDPFVTIDREGVGELMRKDLKLGIWGEHGGDPASVRFCDEIGLDYVSCSPYRVPIARLAATQAALSKERADTTA
jgi:pyruvate, orthophosphate dikinase